MSNNQFDYDIVVIGSGFGGSVTALRLTEEGYPVGVLEAGRRFTDDQFAKTSWMCAVSCGRRNWAASASSASTCCGTA
jgi:choline dehydrogenase-like flavoprotein